MACCENHDRLDRVLNVAAYLSQTCGSMAYKVTTEAQPMVLTDPATGAALVEKKYCCFDCPTLIAAHTRTA